MFSFSVEERLGQMFVIVKSHVSRQCSASLFLLVERTVIVSRVVYTFHCLFFSLSESSLLFNWMS